MLLRVFKGTSPGVIFLIIITLFIVWSGSFLSPRIDYMSGTGAVPMPLYGLLNLIIGNSYYWGVIFSFALVSAISILLINFNTTDFFINERTFLPALLYILASGLFPEYQKLNSALPASLFLMLSVRRIMDGYRKPGTAYNFFDAALLISTGSLFYANLIWFGVLVIIGIALLRTGNIGELALAILGLITPYLITFGFYYVFGHDLMILSTQIADNLFGQADRYSFSRLTIIVLLFAGIMTLVSIVYLQTRLSTKKIKSRQTFSILMWLFIISLVIYFFIPSVSVEIEWITSIPVSYFLGHYFVFDKRKMLPELFFTIYFILILLIQITYQLN